MLSQLGLDPTQQADLHGMIAVSYTANGVTKSVTVVTPATITVDSGSVVTITVASPPQGYQFANQWDDYYGASQYKGATFSYNVGTLNHKTAAFFVSN